MREISFELYDEVKINYEVYKVNGIVEYKNDSKKIWKEYKLSCASDDTVYWLSVSCKKYILYKEVKYKTSRHSEASIDNRGCKKIAYLKTIVNARSGDVGVYVGDEVTLSEYNDTTEECVISIKKFGNEVKYFEGHYIKKKDIINTKDPLQKISNNKFIDYCKEHKILVISIIVILLMIIAILILMQLYDRISGKKDIANCLKDNSIYTYETSIESSGLNEEKAQVYKSEVSINKTVRNIIESIYGNIIDAVVNDDENDGTVIIVTEYEYCVVYNGEDNEVLVQVSSRLFTYTNDAAPYKSMQKTRNFYRGYYYANLFEEDSKEYSSYNSYYTNADTSEFDTIASDNTTYNELAVSEFIKRYNIYRKYRIKRRGFR